MFILKRIFALFLAVIFVLPSLFIVLADENLTVAEGTVVVWDVERGAPTVWSLARYLNWYADEGPYPSAGIPVDDITIIENEDGTRGLHIVERSVDWAGIDIRFGGAGAGRVVPQESDFIRIVGSVENPGEETAAVLMNAGGTIFATAALEDDGAFVIMHPLTAAEAQGLTSLRVATTGTEAFYVYSADVFRVATGYNWDLSVPSLAEAFNEYFQIGNIWSNRGQMSDHVTFDMFLHHYNTMTASNHHKVSFLLGSAPNAWNWDFNVADGVVDWAEANDLAMVGHTLIWHTQSQPWLTNVPGTNDPLTRAEAIENMHEYIRTVAGRYAGRMYSWDVVNEVIAVRSGTWWGANPDWRAHMRRNETGHGLPLDRNDLTRWYDAFANGAVGDECGSDYVFYAFRFARMYDPHAILYYNDYNTFSGVKREAIAQMVEQINERWTQDPLYDGRLLIEGIGMQAHYNLRNWPANVGYVRQAINRFIRTGARVSITELNVYLEGGGIVPTDDLLPELFEEQARRYYELFSLFLEFADYIPRITWFIWVDLPAEQGAWRRWPHSQRPALFDESRQTKPAFYAVLEALESAEPANISVPEVVTARFPLAQAGEQYSAQLRAEQTNHAPIRWRVESGELPPGLRLIAATGAIIGTPTQEGAFTFTVAVENALGSGTRELTMAVGEAYYVPAEPEPEIVEEPTPIVEEAAGDDVTEVLEPEVAPSEVIDIDDNGGIRIGAIFGIIAIVCAIIVFVGIKKRKKE